MRRLPKAIKKVTKDDFVKKILAYQTEEKINLPKKTVYDWSALEKEASRKIIRW